MEITPTAKALTSRYMDGTLAAGNYYFCVSDCKPRVGTYYPVDDLQTAARMERNLPAPQAQIISGEAHFIGKLQTITILARVPDYENLTKEQQDDIKG